MTLVQLRHLLALADSGSFSRAAEAVHLTQPALSRSIQTLEDELGQPLFDRLGRHSELTPFGRAMAVRARQVLDDADALRDHGRRLAPPADGDRAVDAVEEEPAIVREAEALARSDDAEAQLLVQGDGGLGPLVADHRDHLMDAAYDDQVYVDDRTIDSHIKRLRKKFKATDDDFSEIETLYGVGYRFSA